ncbi:MAG TPA: M15 family metallopeptidase [Actinomycetota bacterium]|nr:M15 family metallopeptidase [Actinomycetota bacterium]
MRRLLVATLTVIVAASCGGRQAVLWDPPQDRSAAFALPDPIRADPAWVAILDEPASAIRLKQAAKTPGVAVLAPVSVKRISVRGPAARRKLRVAAVDPLPFRSVAPSSTRDAEFVWTALMSDRAVLTFDAADKLHVEPADELRVGTTSLGIGAFADNGTPNLADIMVSSKVARTMRLGPPRLLVFGAKPGAAIDALGRELERRLPHATLRRIAAEPAADRSGAAPQAVGTASGAAIGTMTFRILSNGFIDPDPAWVASNIATGTVPILGTVRCHRIMIPQLAAALAEIEDTDLADEIRPGDYAGCYVPRFIGRDPRRGLSMHAFGLALDLNASTNHLGTRGDMHPDVVRIFQRWGFTWGGIWSPPDPMHFELARIVRA